MLEQGVVSNLAFLYPILKPSFFYRSDFLCGLWTGMFTSSVHVMKSAYYLLGTGESYGPTAQNTQDFPIFFTQLNYVYEWK